MLRVNWDKMVFVAMLLFTAPLTLTGLVQQMAATSDNNEVGMNQLFLNLTIAAVVVLAINMLVRIEAFVCDTHDAPQRVLMLLPACCAAIALLDMHLLPTIQVIATMCMVAAGMIGQRKSLARQLARY